MPTQQHEHDRRQGAVALSRAQKRLASDLRRAHRLYLKGATVGEIAGAYRRSRATMSWLIHRARRELGWFKQWPTCPLCQLPIRPGQGTRDHVIPRGLGSFHGSFTVPSHQSCNNERGKELEAGVLHRSYYAGLRGSMGIRSTQSNRAFVDPLAVARDEGGEHFSDIIANWHQQQVPVERMAESGRLHLPPMLVAEMADGSEEPGVLIAGLSVDEAALKMDELLRSLAARGLKGKVRVYHDDPAFAQGVAAKVEVANVKFRRDEEGPERPGPAMPLPCRLTGYMDETHLRAHGFWLLKAMAFAKIHPRFLAHLARYVRTGHFDPAKCWASWENHGAVEGHPVVEQNHFTHRIEWNVHRAHATAGVLLFGHGTAGLVARYRFTLPEHVKEILIPGQGAVIAGYVQGGRPGEGWMELIQHREVVQTSRPRSDPERQAPVRASPPSTG